MDAHATSPLDRMVRESRAALAPLALARDPDEAADFVAEHPRREELRLVAGVLRDGSRHAVARLVSHPNELLGGPDLAPGVLSALASTLR